MSRAEHPSRSAASEIHRARRSASAAAPLPPAFYARAAEEVARDLLGTRIVSLIDDERCSAQIMEVEAYTGPEDEASHAHARFGVTKRNAVMFERAGVAYVYLIYGMHWCLNAVTADVGHPAAVLIRAARPLEGIESMRARRAGRADRQLLRGPGNLCRALGVDGSFNRHPLDAPPLWIEPHETIPASDVASGPRIGISRATDLPLRFWVRGSEYVS